MTTCTIEALTTGQPMSLAQASSQPGAQLDAAHVGDIKGGLGTIREHDVGPRIGWSAHLRTLLARNVAHTAQQC
jgi:hypothetical protein